MKWKMRERKRQRHSSWHIFPPNITPLMFPDMEWEHRTLQQLLQFIKHSHLPYIYWMYHNIINISLSTHTQNSPYYIICFLFYSNNYSCISIYSHPQHTSSFPSYSQRICKTRIWIWCYPLMQSPGSNGLLSFTRGLLKESISLEDLRVSAYIKYDLVSLHFWICVMSNVVIFLYNIV